MQIRFWGTRGSLPVAPPASIYSDKIADALLQASGRTFVDKQAALNFARDELKFAVGQGYGGATSCVEVDAGRGAFVVCDMGSGLREFGLDTLRRLAGYQRPKEWHFFLSHLHWDHIMGFPFFTPASVEGAKVIIHAGHVDAEEALRRQQERISFPVPFEWLKADIEFCTLTPGTEYQVGELTVGLIDQAHSHVSYGYRFRDAQGSTVVYSTDAEYKIDKMGQESAMVDFMAGADLVIADTMYSLADSVSIKEDWGHSSNIVAVDLCHEAGAKRLALFHHEPTYSDADIQRMHDETIRYEELTRSGSELEVICSHDGLCVEI
ncbi:MAG: MBL fold metallo-hydrolase [Erythrobacter sp.]|uniref:MBL fold metallo-hydrolase n=1 Tax=Erythrobacter sp. TaxID=1042 RepID=UPI0026154039|nr:MBL fold metallo-hydrolase [Erythrobacter sp.]MDJ0977162.1 MBL fold metallo-hydrolase [Erythrobacter sp.]